MVTSFGHLPESIAAAWAHHPMRGGMFAHYFIRGEGGPQIRAVHSLCGLVAGYETRAVHLLKPVNLPRCKHCERMAKVAW